MSKILFVDVESVPTSKDFHHDETGMLFEKRYAKDAMDRNVKIDILWDEKASFHAEFGKACCVSIGAQTATKFQVKAIASRTEKEILLRLADAIEKSQCQLLCAHNGLEFDFPFLMRRYIINGVPIPPILNPDGKKPWETPYIDTMKMWSGSAWNYKVSLDLLAHVLGIPSPKTDMDGSMVADLYYGMFKDVQSDELPFSAEEAAIQKIGKYCNGDVVTLYKVYCKMKGIEAVSDENIVFA